MNTSLTLAISTSLLLISACEPPREDDAGVPDLPAEPEAPVHLQITFDYRYDESGFFRPQRRAILEEAAKTWGRILDEDFVAIPAGTPLLTRDPARPSEPSLVVTSEEDIEDVLIFVALAELDGIGGATARSFPTATLDVDDDDLAATLSERYDGAAFRPWSGWIAFDVDEGWFADDDLSTDDIPAGGVDLYTNALHEIGHILGVGTSPAFAALVDDGAFTGESAVAIYGAPVPLSGNETHVADEVVVAGERVLMDVSDPPQSRFRPTDLDIAILKDIGYAVTNP